MFVMLPYLALVMRHDLGFSFLTAKDRASHCATSTLLMQGKV